MLLVSLASHQTRNLGRFAISESTHIIVHPTLHPICTSPLVFTSSRFNQQDSVSLDAETTPDFQAKKALFYEEHLHEDAEVRLVVQGIGYFDVRDDWDRWVRPFPSPEIARTSARRVVFFWRIP